MIITNSAYKTSSWSGGKTTEIFIYPPNSSYQARDFQIRISSATVEVGESNFTKLPDYNRVLMILSGQLEINHTGEYSKVLKQYESDYFSGGWETSAKGKVVDFNLMTPKDMKGELVYQELTPDTEFIFRNSQKHTLLGLYLLSGKLLSKNDNRVINPQDLLIVQKKEESYTLHVLEKSEVIQIYVFQEI